jgi:beta-lactamase regulating signal transducer with metallopeptidase domain
MTLAVFLPVPTYKKEIFSSPLPSFVSEVLSDAVESVATSGASTVDVNIALATWLLGVFVMSTWLVLRQRAFVRSLGSMGSGPDGVQCSDSVVGPLLVGAWRARVIVPVDFEARYNREERLMMLAHERAHLERGDALVNAMAAAWLCLFWFNPLMYWALGRLHFDQELACDALVLSRSSTGKGRYARALLSVQMPIYSAWRRPVGCYWKSSHHLKARIAVLKYPSPGRARRVSGVAFTVALAISGIYAVTFTSGMALAQKSLSGPVPALGQPSTDASPATRSVESTAKRITIDARNEDTRNVLMMIANKSGHNILISDQVGGKVTVQVKDVSWTRALEIVALSQGLITKRSGDIVLVDVAH